jgi:hypothetical protein
MFHKYSKFPVVSIHWFFLSMSMMTFQEKLTKLQYDLAAVTATVDQKNAQKIKTEHRQHN